MSRIQRPKKTGPWPGQGHAAAKRIKIHLQKMGIFLPHEEFKAIRDNFLAGGNAWRELEQTTEPFTARGLIEAIMHSQVRHQNSDYDSIPKMGMSDEQLAWLREEYDRKVWKED